MTEGIPERNPEHDKFGNYCAGSRWFNGEPEVTCKPVVPRRATWGCPIDGCNGTMEFNDMSRLTGYHHTCTQCGFTAAIKHKKYPCITYEDTQ